MKKRYLFFTILVFSLFSCNDVSDFLFETEQTVEINTVSDGSVFNGGDSFSLSIRSDQAVLPEQFTLTIIDESGVNWGETTVDIDKLDDFYSTNLIVPDELPPGRYIFHIRVFENNQEIASKEITLFKTNEQYSIDSLFSLPQETEAGKDVFIRAKINVQEQANPFMRWTLEGRVLKEGFLSEGLDTLHWKAGEEVGLYSIRLDVFPEEVDADLLSSINESVEIVVSEDVLKETEALKPDEDFSLLYHFAGDLSPVSPEKFVNSQVGEVGAKPFENSYLYFLGKNSGVKASGNIFPSNNGLLTPFSLEGRFSLTPGNGNIFSLEDNSGFKFKLKAEDSGYLSVSINGVEAFSEKSFPLELLTYLTIHLLPGDKETEIRWFFDGLDAGSSILETGLLNIDSEQYSNIGGDENGKGAGLVLDEFGVFRGAEKASTVDGDQFQKVKEFELGKDLVSADGFDRAVSGLSIAPGTQKKIGDFIGSVKDLKTVISYETVGDEKINSWDLIAVDENGSEAFRIPAGQFLSYDSVTGRTEQKFILKRRDEGMSVESLVESDERPLLLEKTLKPGEQFSLFLESNVDNKSEIILDYYYIQTVSDSQFPETVAAVEDQENLL